MMVLTLEIVKLVLKFFRQIWKIILGTLSYLAEAKLDEFSLLRFLISWA